MQVTYKNPVALAKTLVYGVKHFTDKRKQERLIRALDAQTTFRAVPPLEGLARRGWVQTDSQLLFSQSMAALVQQSEMNWLPQPDVMGNTLTRKLSEPTLRAILESTLLCDVVRAYLGNGARLDDLYLWKKDFGQQQRFDISEGWHTDNVGNRLKVFIGIEATPQAPSTMLVEGSHNTPYRVALSEFTRFLGKIGQPGPHDPVIEIHYQPDLVAIFDTNTLHRGQYQATQASRTCLILEFIDRDKGNRLSGVCPCGPGQSPQGRLDFPATLWRELSAHPLIDQTLLRQDGDRVSYSISNMDNRAT